METPKLNINTKDDKTLEMKLTSAILSETIKSLINYDSEDTDFELPNDIIPLTDVNSNIFELVIKYCDYHSNKTNLTELDIHKWNEEFLTINDEDMFELILAANYLDIKGLLDLTCSKVAQYIKECSTPQEIRRRFNIKNDFTPEEEEEIKKENAWCN